MDDYGAYIPGFSNVDFGQLLKTLDLSKIQAGTPATGNSPKAADPTQMQKSAGMGYGVMNNVMDRIMNPSLNATAPMFTSTDYARPVITSPAFPAPNMPQSPGTMPQGFDMNKAVQEMGMLNNLSSNVAPQGGSGGLLGMIGGSGGSPGGLSGYSPSNLSGYVGGDIGGLFNPGGINSSWGGISPNANSNPYGIQTQGGMDFAINALGPFGINLGGGQGRSPYGNTGEHGEGSRSPGHGVGGR